MSAINDLNEILETTLTAEFVTTMLRDISATKLAAIRGEFEANQEYFSELHGLVALVEAHARKHQMNIKTSDSRNLLYIAVTSNKRFYGNLNHEIIKYLQSELLSHDYADCLVVGQTGQQIVDNTHLSKQPTFTSFAKDDPTEEELHKLISEVTKYDAVLVVHPTFINSFQQHAKVTDITHLPLMKKRSDVKNIDYLFEPDIQKIVDFFKIQVRHTLFRRVLLETQVAFTGARLMKMQRAREKAGDMVKQQRLVIHKETNTVKNMRLLETFTGFNKKML